MTRHSQLIAARQRMEPEWQSGGFRRHAVAFLERINGRLEADWQMPDIIECAALMLRYIPDLYYTTDDPPTISICEVEVTHGVPKHKRHDFGALGDLLVNIGVDLRILHINAYGEPTEIRWQDWHLELIHAMALEMNEMPEPTDDGAEPSRVLPRPAWTPRPGQPVKRTAPSRTLDEIIDAAIARRKKRAVSVA